MDHHQHNALATAWPTAANSDLRVSVKYIDRLSSNISALLNPNLTCTIVVQVSNSSAMFPPINL